MVEEKRFLINELAKRARTTIRTIRYYTSEGLLPQPEMDGKYAFYDENHLQRLELILKLKNAYLPLREIRQIMLSLTDGEVVQRLKEEIHSGMELKQENLIKEIKEESSSALDYISNVINTQAKFRSIPPSRPAASQPSLTQTPLPVPVQDIENWQRILIIPGVEIHLKYPTDSDTQQRIQQLLSYAKKIFNQI